MIVKPETVLGLNRKGFRLFWTWRVRRGRPGRPSIPQEVRDLIRMIAQQVREAFPWDSSPRYLLRDRDKIFGKEFLDQVKAQGIKQVLSAPRSPWQRAYVERLIGSIRRECLDHVIVFGERSLQRYLHAYADYYYRWRTHLTLGKHAPEPRRAQPPIEGRVIDLRELGGLHHHYERRAA